MQINAIDRRQVFKNPATQLPSPFVSSLSRTCFGGFGGAGGTQIFGLVTLVKENGSVEILAAPFQQLFESRVAFAAGLTFADERGVGGEDDAFPHFTILFRRQLAVFEFRKRMDLDFPGADVAQVSDGIQAQIVGNGEPNSPFPALTPILVHDTGQCPTFAHAGAVAD